MAEWITNLDFTILRGIVSTLRCGFLDAVMPRITFLGDSGLIWLICAAVMLATKKHRRTGLLLLAGLAVGVIVGNVVMKNLFARPRPCWLDTSVTLLIANPTDYSFPSGHTLSSVIAATLLTASDSRMGFVAIPLAALIAFSRLYLFVHFPSDVLASVVLGLAIGLLVWRFGGALTDRIVAAARK